MKILVQNCLTHLYLKGPSEWTPGASEAKVFPSSESALDYCHAHEIPAVQVVLKFDSDRYDIRVPISEECDEAAERKVLC